MPSPLPLADPAHPSLVPVLKRNLRRRGLGPEWEDTVRRLSVGELSPKMLPCCGSGCTPCMRTVVGCAGDVLRDLQSGDVDPDPEGAAAMRQKAGKAARWVARGLKRRIKTRLGRS